MKSYSKLYKIFKSIKNFFFNKISNPDRNNTIKMKKELEDRLKELLLKGIEPYVITLNGKWGVGKTYFWNHFKEKHLKKQQVACVSLFGKKNIESIQSDIISQIYESNKIIEKIEPLVKIIPKVFAINISSLFAALVKKNFKNVIICFDDFERISNDEVEKEILGFISQLKEDKNCKVVMILNENKIDNKINLNTYKEKVIDYEFNYSPTVEDNYSLVEEKLKCFKEYPLKYFKNIDININNKNKDININNKNKDININNIRVMKRVINSLNDFEFVQKLVEKDKDIEEEIVNDLIQKSTINAMFNEKNFNKIVWYHFSKKMSQKDTSAKENFKSNEDYDKILPFIDKSWDLTGIRILITEYINSSIPNENKMTELIKDEKKIQNREKVKNDINKLHESFRFDLKYKSDDFVKKLYSLFKDHSENIVRINSPQNFIYYINLLKRYDSKNEKEYRDFGIKLLKSFFDDYILSKDEFSKIGIEKIKNFDPELKEYIENKIKEKNKNKISTCEKVIKMMEKINNGNHIDEPSLLLNIEDEKLKNYFLESKKFTKTSFDLIKKYGIKQPDSLGEFIEKLMNAMEEIKKSDNKDQQIKMTELLDYFEKGIFS